MTQDEIDKAWSDRMASLAVAALSVAKLMRDEDTDRIRDIIAEEIFVRLIIKDRPDPDNWHYTPKEKR
jgi:hypothetical protein